MRAAANQTPRNRANPWVRHASDERASDAALELTSAAAAPVAAPLAPQPGVKPPAPGDRLPLRPVTASEQHVAIWLCGAHGGSGESSLERLIAGSRAAAHAWPTMPGGQLPRVLLLARTHHSGLLAARHAVRDWASGEVLVELVGLVLIADAPGRLPKPLRDLADVLAGGAPRVWRLPWIEAWRAGETLDLEDVPRPLRALLSELQSAQPTTSK
jgi:hypothetical protein